MAAGNAVIGALRVVIGADTAALEKGLKQASDALSKFGNLGSILGKVGIGAGIGGILTTIETKVKDTIDRMDEMGKSAQKIGIPVEELSKLEYAAKQANLPFGDLQSSLKKFDVQIAQTAAGAQTGLGVAFNKMGISIRDANGNVKDTNTLFGEVADKFATYKDGLEKTNLSQVIFNKGGEQLIPILNQGKAGLKAAGEEATRYGTVVTAAGAAAADQFNSNLTRIAEMSQGMWQQITTGMLPALNNIAEAFVKAKDKGNDWKEVGRNIGEGLQVLATLALGLATTLNGLVIALDGVATAAKQFATGDITGLRETAKNLRADLQNLGKDAKEQFDRIWGNLKPPVQFGPEFDNKVKTPIVAGTKAIENAVGQYLNTVERSNAVTAALGDTSTKTAGQIAYLTVVTTARQIALEKDIPLTDALIERINKAGQAAAAAASQKQSFTLGDEFLAPWEKYNQTLEKNKNLLADGTINADQYARANRKAAVDAGTAWDVAGASIAGSFATIAGTFGKSNSAMATAAKAFSIVQATLSVYTGMAKALELPFPANLAAAAAVAAQGFTFIANIKTQAVPKFAQGGSFRVPGGFSSVDTQFIPMSLAAGEQVDVTPADQVGQGSQITVQLSGQEMYSREHVARLISTINTMTADGYRLKVAPA